MPHGPRERNLSWRSKIGAASLRKPYLSNVTVESRRTCGSSGNESHSCAGGSAALQVRISLWTGNGKAFPSMLMKLYSTTDSALSNGKLAGSGPVCSSIRITLEVCLSIHTVRCKRGLLWSRPARGCPNSNFPAERGSYRYRRGARRWYPPWSYGTQRRCTD